MNITKTNKSKPEINQQSKPLLLISSDYKIETLLRILKKNPSLINSKDQKKETLLSNAIKRKNCDICELILASPLLDLSYLDTKGNSYLHLSVIYQLENIIQLLIKKNININIQNNEGNTALHYAYNTGDIKYISILIENKADINIKNNNGLIPEEIEIDSLKNDIDNIDNINLSNSIYNTTNNSATINMNDKNVNNEYFKSISLNNTGQSKNNKTIKIDWENSEINNKSNNNTKTNLKYSLVNFSYSEDEDEGKNNENENENIKNIKDKKSYMDINKAKTETLKNSDIFDLTSTITYQEKLAQAESIKSHIVGNINIYTKNDYFENGINENNDDIVNLQKIKSPFNNSLMNNSSKKMVYKTESYRNKKITDETNKKFGIKSYNKEYSYNKNNINLDYNIRKDKKDKEKINYINTESEKMMDATNNRNYDNTIFYQPEFNENFSFSPLGTIREPLNKKSIYNNINKNIKLENQQIFYNSLKNVKINKNLKKNSSSYTNNNDSLAHPNPSFLNSKSNMDLYSSEITTEITVNKSNSQNTLYNFLSEIKLDKYYNLLNSNGFEDIQVLINQGKSILAIKDSQLKEAGIDNPGDRAKILIRLQEKAGNFTYQIPKNVYYTCNDLEHYMNDINIKKLYEWLKTLKIENYLENFIEGGYHSVELMLIQMESKNPITDEILKNDLGINKIGHRARIINKLLEEGKKYNNKLKTSMLIVGSGQTEKICDCIIF